MSHSIRIEIVSDNGLSVMEFVIQPPIDGIEPMWVLDDHTSVLTKYSTFDRAMGVVQREIARFNEQVARS